MWRIFQGLVFFFHDNMHLDNNTLFMNFQSFINSRIEDFSIILLYKNSKKVTPTIKGSILFNLNL